MEFEEVVDLENNKTIEEVIQIKRALDDKVIYRDGEFFIFDYNKIIEEQPEIYTFFTANPDQLLTFLKSEMFDRYKKVYPLKYINLNQQEQISNLRVEHLGQVVKVSGLLSNATGVLGLVKFRKYECLTCGSVLRVDGSGKPKKCSCGNKTNFKLNHTEFQNIQEIVLEENQDEIGDRSPRRTRVRLVDELCDKEMSGIVRDGNKIEVLGIVEEIPLKKDTKTEEEIYEFRLFALQVRSLENEFDETITSEDIEEIERISADEPLNHLSKSLAPGIIGHEDVKKCLILSMVGGVPRKYNDGKMEKHRIHGLLIGDASQGKTALLQESQRRHYKSRYVSGERLSEAGISASVEKDEFLGTWVLKAGHLPKCNGGFVQIDELDKADKNVQKALHTPMESGIVTIAKAGISAILNANCTIVCGANPKNSRFDDRKSLVEQINMEETLLSRFDWIFVMRDTLDETKDKHIAESIWEDQDELTDLIPVNLFRKYMKYCQNFNPKTNLEARKIINDFYIKIRGLSKSSNGLEGMPIVPRHLKGLRRMAEAHAKIRLSEEVTELDAKIAVNLFKESLLKLGLDDGGAVDFARVGPGKTISNRLKLETIHQIIKKLSQEDRFVQEESISFEAIKYKIEENEVNKLLSDLSRAGEIYSPRQKVWSLT